MTVIMITLCPNKYNKIGRMKNSFKGRAAFRFTPTKASPIVQEGPS